MKRTLTSLVAGMSCLPVVTAATGSSALQAVNEGVGAIPGTQVAITRDESTKHTTYRVAIPWAHPQPIQPSDGLISLSMPVNDNNGAGRRRWIEWGSGTGFSKHPSLFTPVVLGS